MAYYNGELLKQNLAKSINEFEGVNVPLSEVAIKIGQAIKNTPTADVVEVVRCKDCKHKEKETNKWCKFWNKFCAYDDNYCSYGERRNT